MLLVPICFRGQGVSHIFNYTVFNLMLTTENCFEQMMNLPGRLTMKNDFNNQYVDPFINYFFIAISKIGVQSCQYWVKLHLFSGSAHFEDKADKVKDVFV